MKSDRLLHPALLEAVAAAGHGDVIVIADAGLRVPPDRPVIHLGLTCGIPTVEQVVAALRSELVVESACVASEFAEWNPEVRAGVVAALGREPAERPHAELMADMAKRACLYVKTGECSAFASVALVCGVSFFDEAMRLHERLQGEGKAV
jgi:D-ribose pyranase